MRNEDKATAGERIHAAYEQDRSAVDQSVIDTISKLFKLASNNTNQHEVQSALAKAHKLMEDHNLSEAAINGGASSAKAAKRTDEKHKGGLYTYQRELWEAIASLNFCFYFHTNEHDPDKLSKYWVRKYGSVEEARRYGRVGGYTPKHRLVGRAVNVAATLAMAGYLEQSIERILKERIGERVVERAKAAEDRATRFGYAVDEVKEDPLWGEWAVKYREGIADTVISKIQKRRRDIISEQKRQSRINIPDAPADGVRTGTALSLMDVTEQEHAANYDFLHGEGAYAKLLEMRAKWAAEAAQEEAEFAAWAAANPKEAKEQEEARRKSARRSSWNAGTGRSKHDHGAYWDGREAGKQVSIDPQAGADKVKGLLT